MFRNYLVAALRNLARNKLYSTISIFGLAIGICAAILMGLLIRNQLSYDKFIPGYERTYVGISRFAIPSGGTVAVPDMDNVFAALLKLNFPQIEASTRLVGGDVSLRRGQIEAKEAIYWADPDMFAVLPLPVIAGDSNTALTRPDGIVLTRSMARKYFGRDDPIGEEIELTTRSRSASAPGQPTQTIPGGTHPMMVTAVIEDLPPGGTQLWSDLSGADSQVSGIFASGRAAFSELTLYDSVPHVPQKFPIPTFLRLVPNAPIESLRPAMSAMLRRSMPPEMQRTLSFDFIRLDRVHLFLNPGIYGELEMAGLIGCVILFIASANFVNLSTARSARRALEVGIRKASGAERRALIVQFLGETLIYVMTATCIATALAELLLPYVNGALNSGAVFDYWRDPALVGDLGLGILGLAILAGLYPAFVLSTFNPATALRGAISGSRRSSDALRQVLVATQFAILIGLAIAATVVYRQREYATQEALRLDTDQILVIRRGGCEGPLMTELRALPDVSGAPSCATLLDPNPPFGRTKSDDGRLLDISVIRAQTGLFELYGLKPIAGRFFRPNDDNKTAQATAQAVINEAAVHRLGYSSPSAAIGQTLDFQRTSPSYVGKPTTIIGVVPDFSLGSVEHPIDAMIYTNDNDYPPTYSEIHLKLTGRRIPETLAAIDRIWTATGQKNPIDRFFLSVYIQNLYISVLREAQGFALFSGIAVLLACLGLVGLSAATAQRRTKEIGIRKAMGANTGDVVRLLTWEFAQPVLWANVIAWPIAYFSMNRWLAGFGYHIDLSPWIFFVAGGLALIIALATVSVQSLVTARAKPIKALRYE